MPDTASTPTSTNERPFAATFDKYNAEYASGKLTGSNFPHHEVRSVPGYVERNTPGLTGSDVTKELARHLTEYAEIQGCPLAYEQRDTAIYLWAQASRNMLAWAEIFNVVRAAKNRNSLQPIAHYFGYFEMMEPKGAARDKRLIKLIRYITQEGQCAGCGAEFQFDDLTLDGIKPGKENGKYELPNVQLMCQPCNNRKGDSCYQ